VPQHRCLVFCVSSPPPFLTFFFCLQSFSYSPLKFRFRVFCGCPNMSLLVTASPLFGLPLYFLVFPFFFSLFSPFFCCFFASLCHPAHPLSLPCHRLLWLEGFVLFWTKLFPGLFSLFSFFSAATCHCPHVFPVWFFFFFVSVSCGSRAWFFPDTGISPILDLGFYGPFFSCFFFGVS